MSELEEKNITDPNDFKSYKEGYKLNNKETIESIASQGEDHIVYSVEEDFGCYWRSKGISSEKNEKLRKIDGIFAHGYDKLLGVHNEQIDVLFALAITAVLNDHSEPDTNKSIEALSKAIETTPKPHKVINLSRRLHVWIDHKQNAEYIIKNCKPLERYAIQCFHKSLAYAHSLIPTDNKEHLKEKINLKIGIALSEAYEQSEKSAIDEIYSTINKQIKKIAENSVKSTYLWLTSLTTSILITLAYIAYYLQILPTTLNTALIPIAGGFLGTYLSVLARSNELAIDEQNSDKLILLQGALRVVMGGTFGLVGYSCAEAGIALSIFKDTPYSLLVLGTISGFSERLIPELINNLSRPPQEPSQT